jgi:hypothetical protein
MPSGLSSSSCTSANARHWSRPGPRTTVGLDHPQRPEPPDLPAVRCCRQTLGVVGRVVSDDDPVLSKKRVADHDRLRRVDDNALQGEHTDEAVEA